MNLTATQIAERIVKRELTICNRQRIEAGPADGAIFNEERGNSVAEAMRKMVSIDGVYHAGVNWVRANKSRKDGWKSIRQYLFDALPDFREDGTLAPRNGPGLFVFSTCKDFIRLFPGTVRDEKDLDDVDTDSEDHLQDETRYFIASQALGITTGRRRG